jgi:DNA-binding response OmpR family regulator
MNNMNQGPDGQGAGCVKPVLVVEDEALIAALIEDELQTAGFNVVSTHCGDDAIKLLSRAGAAFSCLITDVHMPSKSNGWDVADHARQIWPTLPVIYVTGAGSHDWPKRGVQNSRLITKPFAAEAVVAAAHALVQDHCSRRHPASR